jgi:hypothetical protein
MVYLFLPIFTVLLFEKFGDKTYIINSLVSLIFVFCIYSLYLRIDDESLAKFYKQVNLSSNRVAYYVLYNKSETKKVLDKLDLPNSKIDSNSSKIPSKTTHAVLTYDICENQSMCKFDLIGKIDSRGDSEIIYVFKTNQNKN